MQDLQPLPTIQPLTGYYDQNKLLDLTPAVHEASYTQIRANLCAHQSLKSQER